MRISRRGICICTPALLVFPDATVCKIRNKDMERVNHIKCDDVYWIWLCLICRLLIWKPTTQHLLLRSSLVLSVRLPVTDCLLRSYLVLSIRFPVTDCLYTFTTGWKIPPTNTAFSYVFSLLYKWTLRCTMLLLNKKMNWQVQCSLTTIWGRKCEEGQVISLEYKVLWGKIIKGIVLWSKMDKTYKLH